MPQSSDSSSEIHEVLADPSFYKLNPAHQQKVMEHYDPAFGKLSPDKFETTIQRLSPENYKKYASVVTLTPEQEKAQHDKEHAVTDTVKATPPLTSKEGLKSAAYTVADKALSVLPAASGLASGIATTEAGPEVAIPAAAAGQAAGRGAELAARHAIFPEGSDTREAHKTKKDLVMDIGESGLTGAAQEATGRVAGAIAAPILKPLKAAAEAEVPMLPSEASGNRIYKKFEKFASHSIGSSGRMEAFRDIQSDDALKFLEGKLKSVGLDAKNETPEVVGQRVQEAIAEAKTALRKEESSLYDGINSQIEAKMQRLPETVEYESPILDENGKPIKTTKQVLRKKQVGGVQVYPKESKQIAIDMLRDLREQQQFMGKTEIDPYIKMLEPIATSKTVPMNAVIRSRSDLLAASRKLEEALPGKRAGLTKKLASAMDKDMIQAAKDSNVPALEHMMRDAFAFTKELHRKFDQAAVEKIIDTKNPELITGYVEKAGLNELRDLMNPSVNYVKGTGAAPVSQLLSEDAKHSVRRGIIESAVDGARTGKDGNFNTEKFVDKIDAIGDEKGKILFGDKVWPKVKETTDILRKISPEEPHSGISLHDYAIIGAALALPAELGLGRTDVALLTAGGVGAKIAAQNMMARALTNPKAAAKFVEALRGMAKYGAYLPSVVTSLAESHKKDDTTPSADESRILPKRDQSVESTAEPK